MAYTFDQIFAADPSNPGNVAANGVVTIFAPGDVTQTPLSIMDTAGNPLANPVTVNANGYGDAFSHATLDRVAWAGGGFSGFFTSYEGLKDEAVAARAAAEEALGGVPARVTEEVAAVAATGAFKGDPGQDGANVATTREAVASELEDPASPSRAVLSATVAEGLAAGGPSTAKPPKPVVVFSFDDGYADDYNVVRPILNEKGIKGTFGIISSMMGTQYRLTWAQARALVAEGHEIANHSATHVTLLNASESLLDAEVQAAHDTMVANGVIPTGYIYPYSQHNALARQAVRKLYRYGLGGSGSNVQPFGTYGIVRSNLGTGDDVAALKAKVDVAQAQNQLLIFLNHSGTALDASGQAILREVIDYTQSKGIQISTAAQAFADVGNLLDAGDVISGKDYTQIDGQGRLFSSTPDAKITYAPLNSATAATLPSGFPGSTITHMSVSGTTDWPVSGTGAVITNRLQATNFAYTYQDFVSTTGARYTRRGTSGDGWGAWVAPASGGTSTAGVSITAGVNAFTGASIPDSYTAGKVTHFAVSGANGWAEDGIGYVSTYRTETNSGYAWQLFVSNLGKFYTRHASGGSSWYPWIGAQFNIVLNLSSINNALTTYPNGESIARVPANAANPGAEAGTLKTVRNGTDATFAYSYQEFHGSTSGDVWKRIPTSDAAWGAWRKYALA